MIIAIIGPYFYPQRYGIEKVMYAHAEHLAMRGHDVHVLTSYLRFPDGSYVNLKKDEVINGFSIHRHKVIIRRPMKPFAYPSNGGLIIGGLMKTLRLINPDIVHVHNIGAPAWAFISARFSAKNKKPFFYSPYFHPGKLKFNTIRKSILYLLNIQGLKQASKIYHQSSKDIIPFMIDYPFVLDSKVSILRNGVNPPADVARISKNSGALVMLFVGRVDDARKGFAVLADAFSIFNASAKKQVVFKVVGTISDAYKSQLSARFGNAIEIVGEVSEEELDVSYANADIFVMPSIYEGFGMPFIEAMRYGIPVIGTNVGGIPEVVPENAGLLVPVGDANALAKAITRLVNDDMERQKMGVYGERWSKAFYWDAIIDQLESDYLLFHEKVHFQ
ncbi:MAG: glycosyltransferase family 4 protein [Planctomycetia bacterium]|jgi:glycosyltransferase involved in cell wall biosynthesis|nr:glycosyltransferase family 4 protein [Planctomycetia bacterium]